MLQRITIVKIGGAGADAVLQRLSAWPSSSTACRPSAEWTQEVYPRECSAQIEQLYRTLANHSHEPPILFFDSWIDPWSMIDVFDRWLCRGSNHETLSSRFFGSDVQIFCIEPSEQAGVLERIQSAGKQQFYETDWLLTRLADALEAWRLVVPHAVVLVFREVFDVSPGDDELEAAAGSIPDWLRAATT